MAQFTKLVVSRRSTVNEIINRSLLPVRIEGELIVAVEAISGVAYGKHHFYIGVILLEGVRDIRVGCVVDCSVTRNEMFAWLVRVCVGAGRCGLLMGMEQGSLMMFV